MPGIRRAVILLATVVLAMSLSAVRSARAGDSFVSLRMEPGLWGFHDGREFGAAGGGLKVTAEAVELSYDFTAAGAYVSGGYHGPFPAGVAEFLIDVTPDQDCQMNHRVGTTDGRCYQGRAVRVPGGKTTTLSIPTTGVTFPEAWGGNHQSMTPIAPVQAVHLTVGKSAGALRGTVRLTNPRVRVPGPAAPPEPARGEGSFYLRPGDVVLFVGDAITLDGGYIGVARERIARAYPQLGRTGEGGLKFVNAGLPGSRAGDVLRRLGELLAQHRPTVVVLCLGATDCLADASGFGARLREILAALKPSAKAVTLLAPLAFDARGRPELQGPAQTLEKVVAELKAVAAAEGALVADCFTPSKRHQENGGEDLSWGDGVHPDARGREMMAETLLAAWGLGKSLYVRAR